MFVSVKLNEQISQLTLDDEQDGIDYDEEDEAAQPQELPPHACKYVFSYSVRGKINSSHTILSISNRVYLIPIYDLCKKHFKNVM